MDPIIQTIQDIQLVGGLTALNLDRSPVCMAPVTTMNFDITGRINACCYNRPYAFGKYPEQRLHDIWFGKARTKLLDEINKYNFDLGCTLCRHQICIQNQHALIKQFDKRDLTNYIGYPSALEFECDNTCNYECIMCGGKWSSSIRRNREQLPAIKMPYDDDFVKQLDEFIPHLTYVSCCGGEPFVSSLYFKIWNRIAKLNKGCCVCVTSNCSIYNDKVEDILNRLPYMTVTASIDSFNKKTYEFIRKNGNYDNVMKNIHTLLARKRLVWINFCPMKYNIYEVPQVMEFCELNNVDITFIPIHEPLGGKLKGIHQGGKYEYAYSGETVEPARLPDTCLSQIPFIEDFLLSTLPQQELKNICKMLEKTRERCGSHFPERKQRYVGSINSLYSQINSLLK